ncbi:hypothetical protein EDD17DRAFT_1763625 [Pisolithus thermaeus]|nr:hypothetical protein EDD17DRAFT_1763625 [Pisolithus thermaeus]
MALSDAGIMPAIVTLTDETTWLVKCTPYDKLHCHISCLEQELEDTLYDLCHALCKVDDLHHLSAPSMVKEAACDFECAHIASLGGNVYGSSQEAGPSWVEPPLTPVVPPPSSLQGRIQAKPAPQVEPEGKGKAKEPSIDNQAVPDPGPEDEITSAGIYNNIPMVIDTAVQGTLFPEFMGYENPCRALTLGQGKDGMRMILFVRVNNNLYAYSNERLSTASTTSTRGLPLLFQPGDTSLVLPPNGTEGSWVPLHSSTLQRISATCTPKHMMSLRKRLPASVGCRI